MLQQAMQATGHYTVKVEPLADKRLLHEHGFYYCDRLVEPHCKITELLAVQLSGATISKEFDIEKMLANCHGVLSYSRFHRDVNLFKDSAGLRYDNWLKQLIEAQQVYGLYWQGVLAGFIGYSDNNLLLHALAEEYRAMGLLKYWWAKICRELLRNELDRAKNSISVTNPAVLKLYVFQGLSFINPRNIYHCLAV